MIELELFYSGRSVNSVTMIQRAQNVVASLEQQGLSVKLSLVDVLQSPEYAFEKGVMLTPVIVSWQPSSPKMILGVATEEEVLSLVNGVHA